MKKYSKKMTIFDLFCIPLYYIKKTSKHATKVSDMFTENISNALHHSNNCMLELGSIIGHLDKSKIIEEISGLDLEGALNILLVMSEHLYTGYVRITSPESETLMVFENGNILKFFTLKRKEETDFSEDNQKNGFNITLLGMNKKLDKRMERILKEIFTGITDEKTNTLSKEELMGIFFLKIPRWN